MNTFSWTLVFPGHIHGIFFFFCLGFSSGNVSLKIYSGDLVVCETVISYYTDMEEIGNLLSNAANPVEFMCQVGMVKGKLNFLDM